jgi:hypothetical protein
VAAVQAAYRIVPGLPDEPALIQERIA